MIIEQFSKKIQHLVSLVNVKKTALIIFTLNILDAIMTLFWIDLGVAKEANPMMAAALEGGAAHFLICKISLVALGCLLLYKYRKNLLSKGTTAFAAGCYISLGFYHLYGIYITFF